MRRNEPMLLASMNMACDQNGENGSFGFGWCGGVSTGSSLRHGDGVGLWAMDANQAASFGFAFGAGDGYGRSE